MTRQQSQQMAETVHENFTRLIFACRKEQTPAGLSFEQSCFNPWLLAPAVTHLIASRSQRILTEPPLTASNAPSILTEQFCGLVGVSVT